MPQQANVYTLVLKRPLSSLSAQQGGENVAGEDGFVQEGLQQGGEAGLPFWSMRLHASQTVLLVHIVVCHFMYVGDEHLVGVQVEVEGDGADAFWGAGRTEVTQLRTAGSLEMEFEAALGEHLPYLAYRCLREVAFQQFQFLSLHRFSSTWYRCCSCAGHVFCPALLGSCRMRPTG